MSKIVKTASGLEFNQVADGETNYWLLTCPVCGEHLPLTEAMMQGTETTAHISLKHQSSYCEFGGKQPLGADLVAAIQVRLINGQSPFQNAGKP